MWYLFALLSGYVAASLHYKRLSSDLLMPGGLSLWGAYGLLVWAFMGITTSLGLERGIPAFLVVVSVAGPFALVLEYFLAKSWDMSVKIAAFLAVITGTFSTIGAVL